MECSCNFGADTWDTGEIKLYTQFTRKAKKNHRCLECGEMIYSGSVYIYEKFFFDGTFYVHKICNECNSLRLAFYPDGGFPLETLWRDVYDNISGCEGEIPEACVSKLTPFVKEKICDYINQCLEAAQ